MRYKKYVKGSKFIMERRKKLITKIHEGNWVQEVIISPKPYIILMKAMFTDERMDAMLEEIAREYEDVVSCGWFDLMQNPEMTEMFEIDVAPTLVLMTGGVIDIRIPGMPSKEEVIRIMELDKIREYKAKGINYHPKKNFIPSTAYEGIKYR